MAAGEAGAALPPAGRLPWADLGSALALALLLAAGLLAPAALAGDAGGVADAAPAAELLSSAAAWATATSTNERACETTTQGQSHRTEGDGGSDMSRASRAKELSTTVALQSLTNCGPSCNNRQQTSREHHRCRKKSDSAYRKEVCVLQRHRRVANGVQQTRRQLRLLLRRQTLQFTATRAG